MTYNMKRAPMDNVLVRQALAHAVDYNAIRQVAVQGQAVTANNSPITDSLKEWANPALKEYAFDTEKSKQLLAQAGVSNLTLSMIYSLQDPVIAAWATLVKESAAKAGITIDLQGLDRNTYLAKTNDGDYDIYAGSFAIMDEPISNMALQYLPEGAINYSQVNDPALDGGDPEGAGHGRPGAAEDTGAAGRRLRAREHDRQRHVRAEPQRRAQQRLARVRDQAQRAALDRRPGVPGRRDQEVAGMPPIAWFVTRRVAHGLLTLWFAITITFLLLRLLPGTRPRRSPRPTWTRRCARSC